jgi:GH35 family endo-1,4-beta-xylanase
MDLHEAAAAGDVERVRELIAQGYSINTRHTYNYTPLLYAASNGKLDMVRFLVDQGADIDARGHNSMTPLDFTIAVDSFRVFDLLVSLGANIRARDNNGRTVLHTIVWCDSGPRWMHRLLDAVDANRRTWFSTKKQQWKHPVARRFKGYRGKVLSRVWL